MATSLLDVSPPKTYHGSSFLDHISCFPRPSNPLLSSLPLPSRRENRRKRTLLWTCHSSNPPTFDHIPKQFRQENLKDGLMDNFKTAPRYFYGLSPSQMDMFMTEDNPIARKSQSVTEETISSARNYLDNGGMYSMSGTDKGQPKFSMSATMYRGGGRGGIGRPRSAPPDLPSLLLDARIIYLGMPIVPAVTELLVAQLMWLDYDNPAKPIYLYINSSGTQNEKNETVGSETEAYGIADTMAYCKSKVYTVNCGMAYGQAAMLLSLGDKGFRALQPNSSTKLYLPKVNRSSGATIDMWIKAKELDSNSEYYLELLAKGIGKPKEEIENDIQRPKYFQAEEAIAYGIADKIISSRESAFEKRNYDEMLAQSRASSKFTLKKSFGVHQKKIQCIGKDYEGRGGIEEEVCRRRRVVMASLVSTGFLWSGGSNVAFGKGKTRSPFDERRLLEQNKKIQEANNAPVNFPNFVREAFDVKVIANEDYTTRDSGLIYLDLKVGDGDCPKDGQQVTFHYIGYNESGRRIDSSYSQGSPAKIRLGNKTLVPGFEEGISGMRPGGKRRIIIPPELGPPVGPSTFFSAKQYEVFDVELLQVKDCQRRTIAFFSDVVCD